MTNRHSSKTLWVSGCSTLLLMLGACGGGGGGAGDSVPAPQPPASAPPAASPQRGSLQFTAAEYSVAEAASTLTIGVAREGGTEGAVSVALRTDGGSATAAEDYIAIDMMLAFADGEGGVKTISVDIIDDASDEADETIELSLASPGGGATLGARASATMFLRDDDQAATFTVGGVVSGLQGSGLTLRNNGGSDLAISSDGAFVFPIALNDAGAYDVTVVAHPTAPEQECTVTNGSGTVSAADVIDVRVECLPPGSLQTLVYAQEANGQYDLYATRENGLRNTPLATSADDEFFAGVSPDGRILFMRNDVLYSVLPDGTGLATVDDSGHFPTPRGMGKHGVLASVEGRIILERLVPHVVQDHRDLVATFADGSDLVTLASSVDDEEFVGVTPGGRIIFRRLPASGGNVNLYSIRPDGTGLATLAAGPEYEEFLGITAAGRVIFRRDQAVAQQDVYSVNEDGTGLTPVVATAQDERFAAVTPGGQVIFARALDLFIVDADGTDARLLAGGPQIETFQGVAPSGVIVFSRRSAGSQDWNLYAVNPDGTGEVPLAVSPDFETFAGIMSDGRVIYHAAPIVSGASGLYDIYSVGLDGSGRVKLTDTSNDDERAEFFTSQGQVVFTRIASGQADVMGVSAGGGSVAIPLAATAAPELGYSVSTNGRLLFTREQGGDVELWSVGVDGADPQALAIGAGFRSFEAIF